MNDIPNNRASLARRRKRLFSALNSLLENKIIPITEYRKRKKRVEALILELKESMRQARGAKKRGRPKVFRPLETDKACKKLDCRNMAVKGYEYCCRDHAPYGNYGMDCESA